MVTIIQCVNNLDIGGLENLAITLARRLKRDEFQTQICCIEDQGRLADAMSGEGIKVHSLHMSERGKWSGFRELCRLLERRHPCVIHSHNFKPFYYAALARLCGAADGHIHTRHGAFSRHQRAQWRYRLLRPWVDTLVTVSKDGRQRLAADTGLHPDKIGVLANGVDTEIFRPVTDKRSLRRKLGLSEGSFAIVTAARLSPEKDLSTLFHALARVCASNPNAELWLVGDGPLRQDLQSLASTLQLNGRVRFLGFRRDVDKLLAAADLFVLSSISEGLSIALLEAAASGLPIVATDVGGNTEIVNPPFGGFLVQPRDPEALAKAILSLVNDTEMRQAMATAARTHIVENFSLQKMLDQYGALYRQALASSRV